MYCRGSHKQQSKGMPGKQDIWQRSETCEIRRCGQAEACGHTATKFATLAQEGHMASRRLLLLQARDIRQAKLELHAASVHYVHTVHRHNSATGRRARTITLLYCEAIGKQSASCNSSRSWIGWPLQGRRSPPRQCMGRSMPSPKEYRNRPPRIRAEGDHRQQTGFRSIPPAAEVEAFSRSDRL